MKLVIGWCALAPGVLAGCYSMQPAGVIPPAGIAVEVQFRQPILLRGLDSNVTGELLFHSVGAMAGTVLVVRGDRAALRIAGAAFPLAAADGRQADRLQAVYGTVVSARGDTVLVRPRMLRTATGLTTTVNSGLVWINSVNVPVVLRTRQVSAERTALLIAVPIVVGIFVIERICESLSGLESRGLLC